MSTLTLPVAVRRALLAHARRERPKECCGLLLGRGTHVWLAMEMRNSDPDPRRRYRLDERQHIEVRRVVRDMRPRLGIVGVYHSHPAGFAEPSETDLAEAAYPDWAQIIIGLAGRRPQMRAFRLANGRATPMRLHAANEAIG